MIEISSAELYSGYGLIVAFSDGTNARFSVEELLAMHPEREPVDAAAAFGRFAALMHRAKRDLAERRPPSGQAFPSNG